MLGVTTVPYLLCRHLPSLSYVQCRTMNSENTTIFNPNHPPANSFTLASTITKPADTFSTNYNTLATQTIHWSVGQSSTNNSLFSIPAFDARHYAWRLRLHTSIDQHSLSRRTVAATMSLVKFEQCLRRSMTFGNRVSGECVSG